MPSIAKIIEKMKHQPNGIRYEEAAKVLEYHGYNHVRTKGSHRHFRNANGELTTVQYGNPIDKAYVRDILQRIGDDA
ncbi:MAG: type II toxin-antitoxin system HicA family toxin [Defluviitaleaceae bacterium]|nr:type II toxin-antitoxin system HicA family toxin [Defluviitaleaceae bacterium]MCL2240018.1 type II toxin-antitoxin system HicA family toxin [Defluviitaleaceae bacterium]MCL2240689.1 type II toxin-antitoxin system HicA family toxin [Defluviitaleaceae bacterium]